MSDSGMVNTRTASCRRSRPPSAAISTTSSCRARRVFALNALLFMALQAHGVSRLIKPELAALQDPHALRKAFLGPLCYLVGAAAAWV